MSGENCRKNKIFFKTRDDNWIKNILSSAKVKNIYKHSFDLLIDDYLINFNILKKNIHPLGILIPETFLIRINKNSIISIDYPYIKINNELYKIEEDILSEKEININLSYLKENLDKLKKNLLLFGKDSEISKIYLYKSDGELKKPVNSIINNINNNNKINFTDYLYYFGAGDGLTPAFDDFCSGLLLADRYCKKKLIETDDNFFNILKTKTTLTSYWQIKFAEKGKFSLIFEEIICILLRSIIKSKHLLEATNIGHSSGTDLLCGILARLSNIK